MLRTIALSIAAVLTSALALAQPAAADDPVVVEPGPVAGPSIVVVGDSITSFFNDDPGSASQGWWSMVSRDLGASVVTLAEGGSGMNVRGKSCTGTTFGQRLRSITKADYVIIEGGRNDTTGCTSTNRKKNLTRTQQRKGIAAYLSRLGARVDALGIPRHRVLIVSPWGTSGRAKGYRIQSYLRLYSNRNHEGFTYVETGTLPAPWTLDRKHPNREGNAYIAAAVRAAITTLP